MQALRWWNILIPREYFSAWVIPFFNNYPWSFNMVQSFLHQSVFMCWEEFWQESHNNGLPLCVHSWFYSSFREHNQNIGVISLVTALCGIKDPRPILTMIDQRFPTQIHHDIIHQVQCFTHPMTAHIFINAEPHHLQGPHHHQELLQVSSGISAKIHRKPVKFWASTLAYSPD